MSFEEQATILRENLAELLEKEEEWAQAAQTLAGIDLDSGAGFGGLCANLRVCRLGAGGAGAGLHRF